MVSYYVSAFLIQMLIAMPIAIFVLGVVVGLEKMSNKMLLIMSVIDHHNKCLDYDYILMIVLCIIHSLLDVPYLYFKMISLKKLLELVKT